MFDVVSSGDLNRLRDLYHPDYVYTGEDGAPPKGTDAGVAVAQTYTTAFPKMEFEVVNQPLSGDTSVLELRVRGVHQGELAASRPPGRPSRSRSAT